MERTECIPLPSEQKDEPRINTMTSHTINIKTNTQNTKNRNVNNRCTTQKSQRLTFDQKGSTILVQEPSVYTCVQALTKWPAILLFQYCTLALYWWIMLTHRLT